MFEADGAFDGLEPGDVLVGVGEADVDGPCRFVRGAIEGFEDEGVVVFVLGLSDQVVPKVVVLYFVGLLGEQYMLLAIDADFLLLPDLEVDAPGEAFCVHYVLGDFGRVDHALVDLYHTFHVHLVVPDLFVSVQGVDGIYVVFVDFGLSLLELVGGLGAAVEL